MAQTGFTPILLYSSSTGGNAPAAADLLNNTTGSELAINITDGKLFYKDNANAVQVIGWKTTPTTAGGTGITSWAAGDLPYYASGTTLSKLGIGSSGQILTSTGTAPQWSTLSGVAVTTFSAGTTGLTPSSATSGAITLAGTLNVANGGTGLNSLAAGRIPFGAGTSAFNSTANLFWDSANARLGLNTATPSRSLDVNYNNSTVYSSTAAYTSIAAFINSYGSAANNAALATFYTNYYTSLWNIGLVETGSSYAGDFVWQNRTGSSTYAEQMRLTSAGKLGIGTTAPSSKLDVTGTVGSVLAYIYPTTQTTSATQSILKIGGHSTNTSRAVQIACVNGASNDINQMAFYYGYASTIYEGMRLIGDNVSGKLGINNTNPGDVLTVSLGNIRVDDTYGLQFGGTANGIYGSNATNTITLKTSAATKATLDSAGNLGLGVTPSAWVAPISSVLEMKNSFSLYSHQTLTAGYLVLNSYYGSLGDTYKTTDYASQYYQYQGNHIWRTAPSGTAGTAITFTEAMRIHASRGVSIGNTTDPGATNLSVTGQTSSASYKTGSYVQRYAIYKAWDTAAAANILTVTMEDTGATAPNSGWGGFEVSVYASDVGFPYGGRVQKLWIALRGSTNTIEGITIVQEDKASNTSGTVSTITWSATYSGRVVTLTATPSTSSGTFYIYALVDGPRISSVTAA